MASALQKLFRKKLNKSQTAGGQELPRKNVADKRASKQHSSQSSNHGFRGEPQYLTVSSLNSPSSTSVHRGSFSSASSALPSYASQVDFSEDGWSNAAPDLSGRRVRAHSLGSSVMLRDGSDDYSLQRRRADGTTDVPSITVGQFGSVLSKDSTLDGEGSAFAAITENGDEDDDIEDNTIYAKLVEGLDALGTQSRGRLFLIPTHKSLKIDQRNLSSLNDYVFMHLLSPSNLFKDQFERAITIRDHGRPEGRPLSQLHLTATLQPERRSVHVTLTSTDLDDAKEKKFRRTLDVVSETTVYRTLPSSDGKAGHKERVRNRVIFVNGLVVPPHLFSPRPAKSSSSVASSRATMKNEDRQTVQQGVDKASSVTFPTQENESRAGGKADSCPIPATRYFLVDYIILLDPPRALGPLQGPLRIALRTIERASLDFVNAYVYVPGFDAYNASRIRRGILARAWHAFEEARKANGAGDDDLELSTWLGPDGKARLLLLLENVVMGHCHGKVHGSICALRHDADVEFDAVLATYLDHNVSLSKLGASSESQRSMHSRLDLAQAIMDCLGEPEEDFDSLFASKDVDLIRSMAAKGSLPEQNDSWELASGKTVQRARYRIRTPLDVMDVMHATLEEICKAFSRAGQNHSNSLGTDELIPLLAFVVVRSSPRKLASLLYYVRLFGVSDVTAARFTWALTTFEAVVHFLQKDPLGLCPDSSTRARSPTSIRSAQSSIRTPSPPLVQRSGSKDQDRTFIADRSRRSSLPASSLLGKKDDALQNNDHKVDSDGDSFQRQEEGGAVSFKVPSIPASAIASYKHRRPTLSTWASDRVGTASHNTSLRSSQDSDANRAANVHKRASSLSGDLLIRPQIVVRAPSVTSYDHKSIHNRTLASQKGSVDGRTSTSDQNSGVSRAPPLFLEARRRSIDSWSSLALETAACPAKEKGKDEDVAQVRTSKSGSNANDPPSSTSLASPGEARSSTPHSIRSLTSIGGLQSPLQSSSWLPIWASEWGGMSRRPSATGIERQNSGSAASHSRPESVKSQDEACGTSTALARSASNRNTMASGFPSLDSMPSLERHESLTLETDDATSVGSPRDESSILSSPSSVLSSGFQRPSEQPTVRGPGSLLFTDDASIMFASQTPTGLESGSSKYSRKQTRSRTRLLSTSKTAEPLPPRLTTSEAMQSLPSLLARQASLKISSTSDDASIAASSPQQQLECHRDDSSDRRSEEEHRRTSRSHSYLPSSLVPMPPTRSSPQTHFVKLQIPSPVDERTDPISHTQTPPSAL